MVADLPDLSLPPRDEEIQRALAEVDARLSAFVAAVSTAATAWAQQATHAIGRADQTEGRSGPEPVRPGCVRPDAVTSPAIEPPSCGRGPEAAARTSEEERPSASPPSRVAAAKPASAQPRQVPRPPAEAVVQASPQPAPTTPDPAPSAVNEDEALLASLEPEMAKAIRVMRRLSIEKKSVRQLIEEYNATNASAASVEPRKKSWWSRG